MEREAISFAFGRKLKALRQERKMSHVSLAKQLNERYGVNISRDSLMGYEITDATHSKANKLPNLGMRVEYLYCLADFFGVSMDYLLGRTNIKSADIDLQNVCGYTGLSEDSVKALRKNLDLNANDFILLLIHELLSTDYLRAAVQIYASAAARYWIQAELSSETSADPVNAQKAQMLNEFDTMVQLLDTLIDSDKIHSTAKIPARSASDFYYKKLVDLIDEIVSPAFHGYKEREKELFENLRNVLPEP